MYMTGIDASEVKRLYEEGKSTREIGKICGTNHRRVQIILRENGVILRTKKAAALKYARFNKCVICGAVFRPRDSWDSTKRADRKTCCSACHYILQSKSAQHDVGHSQSFYQRKRREYYLDICTWCDSTHIRLDTHHLDRNRENNSKENLMCLCVRCHAFLHYLEDDRGLRGWKDKANLY